MAVTGRAIQSSLVPGFVAACRKLQASLRRHCALRRWNLLAAHVRSNHVHAVRGSRDSTRKNHERVQILREPRAKPPQKRRAEPRTPGAARTRTMVMEGSGCTGGYAVRSRTAGRTHGSVRCRRALTFPGYPLPWRAPLGYIAERSQHLTEPRAQASGRAGGFFLNPVKERHGLLNHATQATKSRRC